MPKGDGCRAGYRSLGSLLSIRTPLRLLLLAVLAGGCGATDAARKGEHGRTERTVSGVRIVGAHQLSEAGIIAGLATRPPRGWIWVERSEYDPALVELDRKRIETYYAEHGFFSARVTDSSARAVAPGELSVRFVVQEGKPSRISSILMQAGQELTKRERRQLADQVELSTKSVFDYRAYQAALQRLQSSLVGFGFAHAQVQGKVRVEPDARGVKIEIDLDSGPRAHFGPSTIVGLERIPRSAVEARLAWETGQVYDPALVELTRKRLFQLGVFNSIRVDVSHEQRPAVLPVQIELSETSRHEIKIGAGAGLDRVHYEIRARLDYSLRGFIDPLATLHTRFRPAFLILPEASPKTGFGGEASLSVEQEDFPLPRVRLGLSMGYSVTQTDAYTLQGLRSRLGLERPFLSDRLRVSLGYQFRLQSFLNVSDAIPGPQAKALGMHGIYRLASLDQVLTYDGRDDPTEPHLGFFLGAYFEEGDTYLGGAFSYAKASPEARGYVPLGGRLVLAARARFGWAYWGEVPITQRYYSGGASSQRGFAPQRLSPIAGDDQGKRVPIGGQALFESSVELRFEALKLFGNWLNLVAFTDGADVTPRLSALDFGNLHWAVGGGLRYLTPVGPVRFDVGVRLNRTGPGEPDPTSHYAIHLSLGEAF